MSFCRKFSAYFVLVPQNCLPPPPENSAFCLDILHGTELYLRYKETPGMKVHGYVFFCPEIRVLPVFGIVPGNVHGNVYVSVSFFVWRVLQCGKM